MQEETGLTPVFLLLEKYTKINLNDTLEPQINENDAVLIISRLLFFAAHSAGEGERCWGFGWG